MHDAVCRQILARFSVAHADPDIRQARYAGGCRWKPAIGIEPSLPPDAPQNAALGNYRVIHGYLPGGANIDTIQHMADSRKIVERMRREPANVRFADLRKVCEAYFGKPRQSGTSHAVFKTPWIGDPRINIQK